MWEAWEKEQYMKLQNTIKVFQLKTCAHLFHQQTVIQEALCCHRNKVGFRQS